MGKSRHHAVHQGIQKDAHRNIAAVVGAVEFVIQQQHARHPVARVGQRCGRSGFLDRVRLQRQQAADGVQVVLDPVVDLLEQQHLFRQQFFDPLFRLPQLGDVDVDPRHDQGPAVPVPLGDLAPAQHPAPGAVLVPHPGFVGVDFRLAPQVGLQQGFRLPVVVGMLQVHPGFKAVGLQFSQGITEQSGRIGVEGILAGPDVPLPGARAGHVQQVLQSFLFLLQPLLGCFQVRNVLDGAGNVIPGRVVGGVGVDMPEFPVRTAPDDEFHIVGNALVNQRGQRPVQQGPVFGQGRLLDFLDGPGVAAETIDFPGACGSDDQAGVKVQLPATETGHFLRPQQVGFPHLGLRLGLEKAEGHLDAGFQDRVVGVLLQVAVVGNIPHLVDVFLFPMGGQKDDRQFPQRQNRAAGFRTVRVLAQVHVHHHQADVRVVPHLVQGFRTGVHRHHRIAETPDRLGLGLGDQPFVLDQQNQRSGPGIHYFYSHPHRQCRVESGCCQPFYRLDGVCCGMVVSASLNRRRKRLLSLDPTLPHTETAPGHASEPRVFSIVF